jgi:hypothetical protein
VSHHRSREGRELIEELPAKVEALWKRQGYAFRHALFKAVAERFPAARLKPREFSRQVQQHKMNPTYQRCLAEFAEFDAHGALWKSGTCADFIADMERRANSRELIEDDQFVDAQKRSSDLALLALFAPRNAPAPPQPGALYISFTLNCPRFLDVGFECGVKTAWLQFDLGKGTTTHPNSRRGFGEGTLLNNARLHVHDPDFHKPSWILEAADGKWIGWVEDVPADFLLAFGLVPGQTVRAELRVCISEVGVSFSLPHGHERPAKTKLKQRLKQLQIVGDNDGKASIASIAIRLKAKPVTEQDPSTP